MDTDHVQLGPLEQRVLDHLWRCPEPVTVREVRSALGRDLAYTTVMTTLDRLFKKGLLERTPEGRAFRYAARATREAFSASLVRGLLSRLFRKGASAAPLLASLVDAVGDHDRELLPELERLVRQKERLLRRGRPA
jgi:predicted transcriptional regulator